MKELKKSILLSGRSQSEKRVYCMISIIRQSGKHRPGNPMEGHRKSDPRYRALGFPMALHFSE